MAELNVDDPSFWFNDVLAARDEDEAIVDECYEAATDVSDYAGSISALFVQARAEIGTPGPVGSNRVKIRNSWYASRGWPMQKLGPCHMREASGKSLKIPGMPAEANRC